MRIKDEKRKKWQCKRPSLLTTGESHRGLKLVSQRKAVHTHYGEPWRCVKTKQNKKQEKANVQDSCLLGGGSANQGEMEQMRQRTTLLCYNLSDWSVYLHVFYLDKINRKTLILFQPERKINKQNTLAYFINLL